MKLTDLCPEDQLLLCCARTEIDSCTAAHITDLLGKAIDWRRLLDRATYLRVVPLVHRTLTRLHSGAVPEAVLQELSDDCTAITGRNLLLTAELIRIIRWLANEGIAAIPYKGPALATMAYGNLGLRQFGDLDILVQPCDYLRTQELFLARGYRLAYSLDWECALADDVRCVDVDLHRGFSPQEFPPDVDFDRLWRRVEPIAIAGGRISTFRVEDMLLVLCLQLYKDALVKTNLRLSKICDIAELLRAHPDIRWDQVVSESKCSGTEGVLTMGLSISRELLGSPRDDAIPRPLYRFRLDPVVTQVIHRLFDETWNRSCDRIPGSMYHFLIRERWRDKLFPFYHELWRRLSPNEADFAILALPRSLRFFYYVIRPIRLVANLIRLAIGISKAKWAARNR